MTSSDSFQTDAAISSRYNGQKQEKELEPWFGGDSAAGEEALQLEEEAVSIYINPY